MSAAAKAQRGVDLTLRPAITQKQENKQCFQTEKTSHFRKGSGQKAVERALRELDCIPESPLKPLSSHTLLKENKTLPRGFTEKYFCIDSEWR